MFTFSNTSIRMKLATAVVVVAGALALPAVASAAGTADGCGSGCEFVGGVGASNVPTVSGGATQFVVNTGGPGSGGGAAVTCADSRAHAVTDGTDVVDVTLLFAGCQALGLDATVTCSDTPITIDTVTSTGVADGTLELGLNDCTIVTVGGLCTIRTSNTVGGQPIAGHIQGADQFAPPSVLTVPVAGNTDALTFNASFGCAFGGVPLSGNATFSNDPPGSPPYTDLEYHEVGNNLVVEP